MPSALLWIPDQVRDDEEWQTVTLTTPFRTFNKPYRSSPPFPKRHAQKPLSYNVRPCFKLADEQSLPDPPRHPFVRTPRGTDSTVSALG
ncbi:hypothetical protein [Sphingopyxis sp. Geo48]|uniref:hypothetical protein n=1 Tax=Sphingopyxis sp. Geo48 TaxID=545241 RepID=UPI0024B7AFF3|nr:hypothetical protein [Sphingopyxis sp. Geo48]